MSLFIHLRSTTLPRSYEQEKGRTKAGLVAWMSFAAPLANAQKMSK